jgi:hypothetical protein
MLWIVVDQTRENLGGEQGNAVGDWRLNAFAGRERSPPL